MNVTFPPHEGVVRCTVAQLVTKKNNKKCPGYASEWDILLSLCHVYFGI